MTIVEVKELTKIYSDYETSNITLALRGATFDIPRGEIVSICGPSGAGKTTLLSLIGGLLEPTFGKVICDGRTVHNLKNSQLVEFRRKTIGYLWQLPEDNLLANTSVLKNVMLPLKLMNVPREEQVKQATELLTMVNLGKRLDHKPHQLSGGEAQRVGLCVALIHQPKILIGDQITGELDTRSSNEVINYLEELNTQFGTTMVIASHKKAFSKRTHRTIDIKDGVITRISSKNSSGETEIKEVAEPSEIIFARPDSSFRGMDVVRLDSDTSSAYKVKSTDEMIRLVPITKEEAAKLEPKARRKLRKRKKKERENQQ